MGQVTQQRDFSWRRGPILKHNSVPQAPQLSRVGNALHLNQIGLRVFKTRMREMLSQLTIVCEEQQPLTLKVKTSYRIEPLWDCHQVEPRWVAGARVRIRQIAGRFVQENIASPLRPNLLPIHADQ
jgi:hypothetical protein